jgi:hypothetical protein
MFQTKDIQLNAIHSFATYQPFFDTERRFESYKNLPAARLVKKVPAFYGTWISELEILDQYVTKENSSKFLL